MRGMHNLLLALTVLLANGCQTASEDVATLQSKNTPNATATVDVERMDDESKVMAFTQCLRDHGLAVRDPEVDADGNVLQPQLIEGVEMDKQAWQDAFDACGALLEGVAWAEKRVDRSAEVDYWLEVARCLAEKGYDVGEPTAEELDTWLGDLKATLDWKNPDVGRAWAACSGAGTGNEQSGIGK